MQSNRTYIFLTLVFIGLSLGGLVFFYRPAPKTILSELPTVGADIPSENNVIPTNEVDYPSDDSSEPVLPQSDIEISDTEIPTTAPTPTISDLASDKYGFSVSYASYRKLYDAPENGGTRFTLYAASGNITIHVGPNWSWLHPGRSFSTDFLVSGQPTFIYETSTQTITDFEVGENRFTVQCVHGGSQGIKDECQKLLSDFRL